MTWRIDVTDENPYRALELLQENYRASGYLPPSCQFRAVHTLLQGLVRSSPYGHNTKYQITAMGHAEKHGESGGFEIHVSWFTKEPSGAALAGAATP